MKEEFRKILEQLTDEQLREVDEYLTKLLEQSREHK